MYACVLRTAVENLDTNANVLWIGLSVLNKNVKIAIIVEGASVN